MKKLLENFQRKWPTYLFEVIVLVVGIYGAFAVEEWNDDRKAEKQKKVYLNHILSNLEDDKIQLDTLLKHSEQLLAITEMFLTGYKNQQLDMSTATAKSGIMAIEKNFNGYKSGMEALMSSGLLDLIPDHISLDLQKYYEESEDLVKRESMSNEYIRDFFEPHFFANYANAFPQIDAFNIRELYKNDTRDLGYLDEETVLKDRKMEIHIVIRNVQTRVEIELYRKLRELNQHLQRKITAELEKV
jgi:hypothetical protein